MEWTSQGHHPILSKEKKYMKLNGFWNTKNVDKGTNIMWRGKDIPFWKHRENLNKYFQMTESSWPATNIAINYEYTSSNHLASFKLREYENGTDVEIGRLTRSGETGLAVFQMVQNLLGNRRLSWNFTSSPPTLHLSTYPETSPSECRSPLTDAPPYLLPMNTQFWPLLNSLDSCWTKKWILL